MKAVVGVFSYLLKESSTFYTSPNHRVFSGFFQFLIILGILNEIDFPVVKGNGVALQSASDAFLENSVQVKLVSPKSGKYTISLFKKTMQLSTIEEVI
jgi:hypothetical protein